MSAETNQGEQSSSADADALKQGHEESLAAARDLVEQVEAAEQAEGNPTPSQAEADETAATGI